ncbi:CPBP family intramembrane glutamic endopeptidase [Pseudalkalibacillus sp. SCS-8]|uniref:CPBP family intramembrane glutamic endopeptidase n=1 Tax=Pseudalkalibacillus nanhaiensis TaxID=3115291 RepID=UPI0032DADDD5
MLIIIIMGLVLTHYIYKKRVRIFSYLPKWNARIAMPSHTIKLPFFLLHGLIGSLTIFIPVFFLQEYSYIKSLILFGFSFALINAVLEELIWRGIMLSSIKKHTTTIYAVIITSVGFGLLHLSIGMSILLSLLSAFGGLFYAFVVLKTKSIYPAILFHFIINVGMVFNGWIL